MPTNLTEENIDDTFQQLLHVDGGVTSTPKVVYDGDGTATGLQISTTGISVGAVSEEEISYLNGVTSAIQTQLNSKQGTLPTFTAGQVLFGDGDNVPSTASNLFWNNSNSYLNVGANNIAATLGIKGAGATSATNSLVVHNSTGSSNSLIVKDNGRTVIGAASGSLAKLQVSAAFNSPTPPGLGSINTHTGLFVTNDNPVYGLLVESLSNGNTYLQVQRIDSLAIAYNMLLQPNGGNIGVNTTSPTSKVHILGSGATSSTTTLAIHNSTGSSNSFVVRDDGAIGVNQAPSSAYFFSITNKLDGTTNPFLIKNSSGNSIYEAGVNSSGQGIFKIFSNGTLTHQFYSGGNSFINNGNFGIGTTLPTAALHIKAGTAAANTAPLKLTAGTNLTTPENGAFEFDGTFLYFTVGGVRKTVTLV